MAGDIKHWLEDLDLAKLADVFIENKVGLRESRQFLVSSELFGA